MIFEHVALRARATCLNTTAWIIPSSAVPQLHRPIVIPILLFVVVIPSPFNNGLSYSPAWKFLCPLPWFRIAARNKETNFANSSPTARNMIVGEGRIWRGTLLGDYTLPYEIYFPEFPEIPPVFACTRSTISTEKISSTTYTRRKKNTYKHIHKCKVEKLLRKRNANCITH